jgi:hypothetical protein
MDEHPLTISINSEARLNINLSDEQLKEVARQVAEILKRDAK